MKSRIVGFLLLLISVCLISSFSFAGSVGISPVSLSLNKKRPIGIFELRNPTKQPVLFQVSTVNWSQHLGSAVFTRSNQLIVTPPIFKILPGKTQIVRVGSRSWLPLAVEQSHRILFTQVPFKGEKKRKSASLRVLLRISVPVFIEPSVPIVKKITWHLKKLSARTIKMTIDNVGNVHALIYHLKVSSGNTVICDQNTRAYFLPHQSKNINLKLTHALSAKQLHVTAQSGWGELTKVVPVN